MDCRRDRSPGSTVSKPWGVSEREVSTAPLFRVPSVTVMIIPLWMMVERVPDAPKTLRAARSGPRSGAGWTRIRSAARVITPDSTAPSYGPEGGAWRYLRHRR